MAQNPDLQAVGNENLVPRVPPLTTMTPPMPNTKMNDFVYFTCTIPNASLFRQDGKKLPFVAGYLKTNIAEDIQYLDGEIQHGNIYIKRATAKEVEAARMYEDPLGMIKDAVRIEVERNVKESYTVEQLEALLKEKKDKASGVVREEAANKETPEQKARRLLASMGHSGAAKLTPASTANLGGGGQPSNSAVNK